ncbi:MAG: anti-sigma factor [Actinomycetota bacterium]|nr:anti-sigma factor [Actinomycetota bacterium]
MELSHEAAKDLIAPYVLGAVSPEEEASIRDHIMSCDECMQEAESLSIASSALPLLADPVELPPGFVDRVVAQVHDARPATRSATAGARGRGYRRWTGVQVVATSGLLVLALILGGFLINQHANLEQRQKVLTALLRHEGDGMVLRGPSGMVAKVIPTTNGSIFVASGLHEPPADHTYQLWLLRNGTPVSAGTFTMKGGLAVLESQLALDGYDHAAVTVEPAGGSDHPTTQPIITSN